MKKNINKKRKKEKEVVKLMINLYCRGNKHSQDKSQLCPECKELLDYAIIRTDLCPFMNTKTFCSNCKVHCYKQEKREKIKSVMRYAGPRLLLHHPLLAISHLIESNKEKRNRK